MKSQTVIYIVQQSISHKCITRSNNSPRLSSTKAARPVLRMEHNVLDPASRIVQCARHLFPRIFCYYVSATAVVLCLGCFDHWYFSCSAHCNALSCFCIHTVEAALMAVESDLKKIRATTATQCASLTTIHAVIQPWFCGDQTMSYPRFDSVLPGSFACSALHCSGLQLLSWILSMFVSFS